MFLQLDSGYKPSALQKIRQIPLGFMVLVALLGVIGTAFLYSAGGLSWQPWAAQHGVRFVLSLGIMLALALVDIRHYLRLAYIIYGVVLALLLLVEIMGHVGMGAQRWLNLGVIVIQPSELMKIALVLVLARYFHSRGWDDVGQIRTLLPPLALIAAPVLLVLLQPNLGTALLLVAASGALFWAAGVRWWKFALLGAVLLAAIPVVWEYVLHDYQQQRVLTFLDPARDPQGAGYNIIQSQIALGAGGIIGRGFGLGTQSQLQFLPEKHTDFIFVVLAEETGFLGALALLALYGLLLGYALLISLASKNDFGRLVAIGLGANLFLYVMANVAMVSGLIPVVGIPLPLISFGGTAMLTLMIACGLLLSVALHRDVRITRSDTVGMI